MEGIPFLRTRSVHSKMSGTLNMVPYLILIAAPGAAGYGLWEEKEAQGN